MSFLRGHLAVCSGAICNSEMLTGPRQGSVRAQKATRSCATYSASDYFTRVAFASFNPYLLSRFVYLRKRRIYFSKT